MKIIENQSLKKFNTFGIEAVAQKFITIESEQDLLDLQNLDEFDLNRSLILGGGSNILFQKDFDGTILRSGITGISETGDAEEHVILEIGSGVIWDDLVKYAVEKEFYGIENLSLIPGTVGAAPIQNIGAYGTELKDVFYELEGVDLETFEKRVYDANECRFGYRDSIFKSKMKNKFFITKLKIRLDKKGKLKLSYRAIQDHLRENNIKSDSLNIKDLRNIIIQIRESKLPDPLKIGNAGSFFKNPVINSRQFYLLKEKNKDLVFFKIGKESYKIPAAWLIEKSGFKGKRFGNAGVHKKQALVIVNYGDATGKEVVNLAEKIRSAVKRKFYIELETEVNIV